MGYFERVLSKLLDKYNFAFVSEPCLYLMDIIKQHKGGLELVISPFSVHQIYVQKFCLFSVSSPCQFWCFDSKMFLTYSKNCNWFFMQTISWCHNCSICNSLLESENDGQERVTFYKILNILITKSAFTWNKKIFSIIYQGFFWWNKKNREQRLKIPNYCNLKPRH